MAKTSFKRGTTAQKARSKTAESLKRRGLKTRNAFALASYITKRAKPAGRKRLAKRGLRKKR